MLSLVTTRDYIFTISPLPLPFPLFPCQIRQMLSLVTTRDYIFSLFPPPSSQSNPADVVPGDDARLHFHPFPLYPSQIRQMLSLVMTRDYIFIPPLYPSQIRQMLSLVTTRDYIFIPSPSIPVKSGRCCPW